MVLVVVWVVVLVVVRVVQRLLVFDPRGRCSVEEALAHPYLAGAAAGRSGVCSLRGATFRSESRPGAFDRDGGDGASSGQVEGRPRRLT